MAIDAPDERDYAYEMTFGSIESVSDHLPFPAIEIQNQGAKASTRMACGQYALTHIVNGQNRIRAAADKADYVARDAAAEWARIVSSVPAMAEEGSTLQYNLADGVKR